MCQGVACHFGLLSPASGWTTSCVVGKSPTTLLGEGAEILLLVAPGDTEFHKPGTPRPRAEKDETTEKERESKEPKATQAVPAAMDVEELGEMEEEMEEMDEEEEEEMEEEGMEEREREAHHDREASIDPWY